MFPVTSSSSGAACEAHLDNNIGYFGDVETLGEGRDLCRDQRRRGRGPGGRRGAGTGLYIPGSGVRGRRMLQIQPGGAEAIRTFTGRTYSKLSHLSTK